MHRASLIRNVAIIAHVDHGKTTLVDQLFRQAGALDRDQARTERILDSNPLERERGITILSKNVSVAWRGHKINIVDTPGHADFGGEVERVLRMVDGVLLLVDAAEGPMPQTRFVTGKALALGLSPIVVVNKVDRADARALEAHDETLDLLIDLDADEAQLDAPFLYASGREGFATEDPDDMEGADGLEPLFQAIIEHIPSPSVTAGGPFQMLVSTLSHSNYVGRIAVGRIERGQVSVGDRLARLPVRGTRRGGGREESGEALPASRITQLFAFHGLKRVSAERAGAGDIVGLAGAEGVEIGDTLCAPEAPLPLDGIAVEEPTMSVRFSVNDSPFAGREGRYVTTRQLRERLFKETERNLALRVQDTDHPDTFQVRGRGELHLSILMETMRREGYEFQVSPPRFLERTRNGTREEPYSELVIETPTEASGGVIDQLSRRKGIMKEMRPMSNGKATRITFEIPSRRLFGYRTGFLSDTRGEGIMNQVFLGWGPWSGGRAGRERGALVSDRETTAMPFALFGLQERGDLFVEPGATCYGGMIVGRNARADDLEVNVGRSKKLSNMRAAGADEAVRLEPPLKLTLELALEFIDADELIEVTPGALRLRKRELDPTRRRKAARRKARERREERTRG